MAPILFQRDPVTRELDPTDIILPTYNVGRYTPKRLPSHMKPLDTLDHVPPLEYFCLKTLYPSVDSVNLGGRPRFMFNPEVHMAWLKGLIPFITSHTRDVDMKYVDPRLWATLIQLYAGLPLFFHTCTLPLSDTHLTQLQAIRSTPDFTLITVLDLSARRELSDKTIGELKPLQNLCVLDLSLTEVGSWGVKKLSMCLVRKDDERIGPWGVRVWSLRGCRNVDHTVKDALVKFPLLCAVDLRDTSVPLSFHLPGFSPRPLTPHTTFYYPNPPLSWINGLCASFPDCQIFQSCAKESLHVIHINTLEYPEYIPSGFEGDYSESEVSELDQDHNVTTDGPLDLESSQTKVFATENEVAAVIAMRTASEQKAVRFYRKPDVRDWDRIQKEEEDQAADMEIAARMYQPIPQPPPAGVQWSLMFYREPPAYDSISHDETGRHVKRSEQPVLAKKRKTGLGPAGLFKVLLNRQRPGEAPEGEGCSQGFGQSPTSMNPFLVKRPVQSPTLTRTTVSQTALESQPRSQLGSHTSTSFTASVSCTTQNSDSTGRRQLAGGGQKQGSKQVFNMRAWAMRSNR